jgi:hypothetical protein
MWMRICNKSYVVLDKRVENMDKIFVIVGERGIYDTEFYETEEQAATGMKEIEVYGYTYFWIEELTKHIKEK